MRDIVIALFSGIGHTNDQQTQPLVSPHDTWNLSALANIGMNFLNSIMRSMPMIHDGLQVD
jgi:hypothetical protein